MFEYAILYIVRRYRQVGWWKFFGIHPRTLNVYRLLELPSVLAISKTAVTSSCELIIPMILSGFRPVGLKPIKDNI